MESITSLKATVRKLQLDLYHKDLSMEESKQKMRAELAEEVKKDLNVLLLEKDDEISRLNQHIAMLDSRMKRMQSGNVVDVQKVGTDEDKETIKSLLEENQRLQEQFDEVSDKLMKVIEKVEAREDSGEKDELIQNLKTEFENEKDTWVKKEKTFKDTIENQETRLLSFEKENEKLSKELDELLKKPKRKSARQIELENEIETMREEYMLILGGKESEIDELKEHFDKTKIDYETYNKSQLATIESMVETLAEVETKLNDNLLSHQKHSQEMQNEKESYILSLFEKNAELEKMRDKISFLEDIESKNASLSARLMEREKSNSRYVKHLEQTLERLRSENTE